jgi:ketosteroid isomerase-like protein
MNKNTVDIVRAFYAAQAERNIAGIEKYLHPNVHFIMPLGEIRGKAPYVENIKKHMTEFKTVSIRTIVGSEDHVMLAYDFDFGGPIGKCPTAGLYTFKDGLIAKIELFFDARPFEKLSV